MRKRFTNTTLSLATLLAFNTAMAQSAPEPREIIAGSTTTIENYPWMANLYVPSANDPEMGGSCGGTLIDPNWILTAGHCFLNEEGTAVDLTRATEIIVTLNSTTIESPAYDAIVVQSADLIVHPDYAPGSVENSNNHDIALLRLAESVTTIQPVTLSSLNASQLSNGQALKAMGWGATAVNEANESINPSDTLKEVDLQYVDNAACSSIYCEGITDNMVCANGLNNSNDTCQGDSGGPLVIAQDNSFQQIGISSFGGLDLACGDPEVPGVYARVSQYQSFITASVPEAQFSDSENTQEPPVQTGYAPTLDANLNVTMGCLNVNGQTFQTGLTHLGNFQWQWNGVITPSPYPANTTGCATLESNLNLTVPNVNYQGNVFTVAFEFNEAQSNASKFLWSLGGVQ